MPLHLNKKLHNHFKFVKKHTNCILERADFGIKATTSGTLTKTQETLLLFALQKKLKTFSDTRSIKVWILLSFNVNVTSLSFESRMGKGKGALLTKLSVIKPGQIIFAFSSICEQHMLAILKFLKNKVSFKLKLTKIKY